MKERDNLIIGTNDSVKPNSFFFLWTVTIAIVKILLSKLALVQFKIAIINFGPNVITLVKKLVSEMNYAVKPWSIVKRGIFNTKYFLFLLQYLY